MLLGKLIIASMTRSRLSVQINSFLKPRVCQALVRSTTQRALARGGSPLAMIPLPSRVR